MRSNIARALTIGLLLLPLLSGPALGHAAFVKAAETEAVKVHAYYDTGEPMSGAQVAIYAPHDPQRPWLTGLTDDQGYFSFIPDSHPGRWSIQARQAGHGAITHIDWQSDADAGNTALTAQAGATSGLQRLIMILSVGWGCIGTALYFRCRRQKESI